MDGPRECFSIVGTLLGYRHHRSLPPMVISLLSAGLILFGFYVGWQLWAMYTGIFGLLLASLLSLLANRRRALSCRT